MPITKMCDTFILSSGNLSIINIKKESIPFKSEVEIKSVCVDFRNINKNKINASLNNKSFQMNLIHGITYIMHKLTNLE